MFAYDWVLKVGKLFSSDGKPEMRAILYILNHFLEGICQWHVSIEGEMLHDKHILSNINMQK